MYLPHDMPGLWQLDYNTFFAINHGASNDILDVIAPILRNKWTWVPLYVLAAAFIVWKWRMQGLLIVLVAGLTVLLTEVTSSAILKPMFMRPRPCYDPELPGYVNLVIDSCRTSFGFPSTHAANHFGMAFFFTWLWGGKYKWLVPILMVWALAISLSQVYVGVHYPLDIFAGFVIGTLLSLTVWLLYRFQLIRMVRHVRT